MVAQSPPPERWPNGPARVTTDNKKERFKLDYAGDLVFQASVKLLREGEELSFKDAAARLFVLSKFDGWDIVTQTIRVAAVATRPDDRLVVRGQAPDSGTSTTTEIAVVDGCDCIYCLSHDWLLSLDPGPTSTIAAEDVPVKGDPESTTRRIVLVAEGPEIMLRFRPYYRQRHKPSM